ncbi:hypothetical protein MNV49_006371 [Pseudohyphozyma bogoriensis]|nr:hypothetical protein MNV49_006371 [Pseudohyphozyma bogoriensis]
MVQFWTAILPNMQKFVEEQKMFWVASAPLSGDGHVNVSPRGYECLTVVNQNACYYIDMTGSGNETICHVKENERITLMWNAFEGPPKIVRFYGRGKILERGTPEFEALVPEGDERLLPGTRCIVWIDVHATAASCGWSVPFYSYEGERMQLQKHARKREEADMMGDLAGGCEMYWANANTFSIDGLPGLDRGFSNIVDKGMHTHTPDMVSNLRLQNLPPHPDALPSYAATQAEKLGWRPSADGKDGKAAVGGKGGILGPKGGYWLKENQEEKCGVKVLGEGKDGFRWDEGSFLMGVGATLAVGVAVMAVGKVVTGNGWGSLIC